MKNHYFLTASVLLAGLAAQPASAQFFVGMGAQSGRPAMAGAGMGMDAAMGRRPMRSGISVDDGNGGWKPYVAPPRSDVIGSGTYEGRTTTVRRNADGSRAISMVDALGRVTERLAREPAKGTISVGDGMGGWVPYTPPARTGDFGSGTYEGRTTTVTRNPDGSHNVTVNENGKTATEVRPMPPAGKISVGDGKGGWVPFVPEPKSDVIGSSTYEGRTTIVTRNPDGSHKVTVTQAPR